MKQLGWIVLAGIVVAGCGGGDGWPPHDGKVVQTVRMSVNGVRRGNTGTVSLEATAHFTRRDADRADTVPVGRFDSIALTLLDASGAATPIASGPWKVAGGRSTSTIELPEVPDGDYRLHAVYKTRLDKGELDLPLPLYTPARIHVITDRPLYEPGNLVRFRAVVLRARDLAPLDHRPGRWMIKDPDGEVLLEEKAPAGDWGVVAGTFPLDKGAPTGAWKVAWVSNDASDEVPFQVEPFTLPRFRVEAASARPYYRPLEAPVVRGQVVYSSGAPVAGANLAITWDIDGDWPPPTAWQESLLPKTAVAGPGGRFELTLPVVPADLQGRVTLTAHLAAIDAAGDRVEGAASVLLSEEGLQVSTVTEIGDGLVDGFNNRMYLRVTTPDGRELPGAHINVKRAWQKDDRGLDAVLDEDGVASLQLDPGAPVNVVIPALPYRPSPRGDLVSRDEVRDLVGGEGASLADQVAMDGWLASLAPCARWYGDEDHSAVVAMRVGTGGNLTVIGGNTEIETCTLAVLRGKRLPAGNERMYTVTFEYSDPPMPTLTASMEQALAVPEELSNGFSSLARRARDCLPADAEGSLPKMVTWSVAAGSKNVVLGAWIDDPGVGTEAASAMACVMSRLGGSTIVLTDKVDVPSMGVARFSVSQPTVDGDERPQATTMLGYELLVSAELEGKPTARLRLSPGTIPDLRLRVSPVLAQPGDKVTAELIRGPDFTGTLPKEMTLDHLKGHLTAKLDADHKATFTIEPNTEGWCEITAAGVRALVYVKPAAELTVAMTPEKDRYAPGDQAHLRIETAIGGKGGQAAVGLIGVDQSLGQLVSLPGADELGRLRPQVETSAPAFGTLDGQALTLGRIRGANAAAATVLRVTAIPKPPELDAVVSAEAETHFDPTIDLTDHFYTVLAELHVQARAWEQKAPPGELMRPATMKKLWDQALAACEKRGELVTDAYGRKLRLSRLPADLLALTDPRQVVIIGTRLPEDVENWAQWVAKEKP